MKITFNYLNIDSVLEDIPRLKLWIVKVIENYDYKLGKLNYILCDDEYLHSVNVNHLDHDTFTDIITFDYTSDRVISGEIYLSVERVVDNAKIFSVSEEHELLRVIIHGVLHLCGLKDKSVVEQSSMRQAENAAIELYLSGN